MRRSTGGGRAGFFFQLLDALAKLLQFLAQRAGRAIDRRFQFPLQAGDLTLDGTQLLDHVAQILWASERRVEEVN